MKIKRLLKIVLVAPSYIVVEENGQNRNIHVNNSQDYKIGEMYEMDESPILENLPEEVIEKSEEKEDDLEVMELEEDNSIDIVEEQYRIS